MKRIVLILILALCLALPAGGLAEASSADEFLSNLSKTWDSLLNMADDAGREVSGWAEDSGLTEWVGGAVEGVSGWAEDSGLTEWADGALRDLSGWFRDSGLTEWAQGTADEFRSLVDENRPAAEAWLRDAGDRLRDAWSALTRPRD